MKLNLQKIVAINLKYFRYKRKLSQEEFHGKAGLNVKYMASIERGVINFKVQYLNKICDQLNISLLDLICFDEKRMVNKKRIDQKSE